MICTRQKVLVLEGQADPALRDALATVDVDVTIADHGVVPFEKLKSRHYDVIVTDGIELLAQIRAIDRKTPVILVSGDTQKHVIINGLRLGACDFIEKPFDKLDMIKSVQGALEKSEVHIREKLKSLDLSQIQLKILELVFEGKVNKDIAARVCLSEQGVKYHVGMLFQRFGAKNRVELKAQVRKMTNQ